MTLVPLDDEVRASAAFILQQVETMLAGAPDQLELGLAASREQAITGAEPRDELAVNRVVDGVPVRIFEVDNPDGVYLHIHGGGWVTGGYDLQDARTRRFADACNVAVVSVEYGLAPETPAADMVGQCVTAARWLVENAAAEFGTDRLVVGGESAGAHLSACMLLQLRDAFVGANLVYGMYDLALTDFARDWGLRKLILNTPVIQWCVENLSPGWTTEQRRDPLLSPFYGDLAGMPPALFTCGTDDPTLHDSIAMHDKWQAANGNATLEIYEHGFHAFNLFPSPLGDASNRSQEQFVRDAVKGTP